MAKSLPPEEPKGPSGNFTEEAKAWFYEQVRLGRNPYQVATQLGGSRAVARKWMEKIRGRWLDGDSLTPLQIRNRMYEHSEEHHIGDITSVVIPAPITRFEDLRSDQAKQAWQEFGYWRKRYLGRRNIQWQIEMALVVMNWFAEAQEKNERVRGVLNTPPGGGKTTTMTHDFPGWVISRDRNIRVGMGSNTTPQSSAYTRRMRNTLEKNTLLNVDFGNFKPEETEVWRQDEFIVDGVTGTAASLDYKLALAGFDYEDPHVKRRVNHRDPDTGDYDDPIWDMIRAVEAAFMVGEKEPTVKALSYQMRFLGGRFDINLWDDLVDDKNSSSPEKRDDLAEWWEEYAVSRAEPGGIIALIGTRFGKYDLFRHCRDMTYSTDEDFEDLLMQRLTPGMNTDQVEQIREDLARELVDKYGVDYADGLLTVDPDAPSGSGGVRGRDAFTPMTHGFPDEIHGKIEPGRLRQKVYHYVKFPAHDDSKCINLASMKQVDHIDCLLDHSRFKWFDLVKAREANPRKYALTYNQEDESTEDNLIQEVWLTGGVDENGIIVPGCYNYNRTLLQIPKHLELRDEDGYLPKADCYSIATVDPSAVNWWSIQWWIYAEHDDTDYLMDLLRVRLSADSFLSYSTREREYHGVLDIWQKRSRDMGWPIALWIIEENASQRYLFQHTWVNEWMKLHQTHIKGHESDPRKADPEYGVQTLKPRYRTGRVDLPFSQDDVRTRVIISEFKQELTEWPDSPTDDMVQGHWFLENNRFKIPKGLKVPTAGALDKIKHPYDDSMPQRLRDQTRQERSGDYNTRDTGIEGHRAARLRDRERREREG